MDAFELLQKKMNRAKTYERPAILLGAYKQLVGDTSKGRHWEYREYADMSDENRACIGSYVYTQLKRYGMDNSAQRLLDRIPGGLTD